MRIVFQERAAQEYLQARQWYRQRDLTVAARFVSSVDTAIRRIEADPDALAVFRGRFRQIRVKRFPYVIYFSQENDDLIAIYAVSHTSRRPGYWVRRKRPLG